MKNANMNEVPIARLIGFEANEIADGRAVVTLAAGPQHANPMGTLHAGVLCDIADAAMGMAFHSTLAPVVRRGNTVGYIECEITDEAGRLVAKSSSTCIVLRGDHAKGR
jgi:acyl-coenzyme A thioesterase PaaI-like protein